MEKGNPLKNLTATRDVAYFFAAFTGAGVVWSIAYTNLSQATGYPIASGIVTIAICMAVLYLVDYGLKKERPYGLEILFSGKAGQNWRMRFFCFFIFLLLAARVGSSIFLSWEGRKDVAAAIIEAPDVKDTDQIANTQDAALLATISPIQKDIDLLNQQIKSAEATAYDRVGQKSKDMIKSGKDTWGYHANIIATAKSKASALYRVTLNEKMKLKDETTKSFSETKALIVSDASKLNGDGVSSYNVSVSRNQKYVGYFGVGCMLFAILIQFILSLHDSGIEAKPVSKPPKPKAEKKPETSKVSETEEKEVSGFQGSAETGEWVADETFGFNYKLDGDVIMVQGFSGWRDVNACKKMVQQYLSKNLNGIGKIETNNRNIARFNGAMVKLGGKALGNPYELKAVG